MRYCLLLMFCSVTCCTLYTQVVQEMKKLNKKKVKPFKDYGWKKIGLFSLTVNQTALNDWPTGGENFIIGINS